VFFLPQELTVKRLELLKEALPQVTRVSALWDAHTADQWRAAEAAAQSLGLQLQSVELRNTPYDFEGAIGVAVREHPQALMVLSSPLFFAQRIQIAELALKHRLPSIFILRVCAGGRVDGLRSELF
jgi:putative ABC transport system substrate-binding protein